MGADLFAKLYGTLVQNPLEGGGHLTVFSYFLM